VLADFIQLAPGEILLSLKTQETRRGQPPLKFFTGLGGCPSE